jgi:hypothetical protein
LLGAVAAGDGAVRPRNEHHVGIWHVDQVRPPVLLREHRHAEGERVHAGEHATAGPEHARDLGDKVFGGQPKGQRPLLRDHAIGAAVGQELKAGPVGGHGGQPAACLMACDGRRYRHLRVDDAQHPVPGAGGDLGGARARTGYVEEETSPAWQPAGELGQGDGGVKAGIVGDRTSVLLGPCGCLHGVTPGRARHPQRPTLLPFPGPAVPSTEL